MEAAVFDPSVDGAKARLVQPTDRKPVRASLKDGTKDLHERLDTHPRLSALRSGFLTRVQYADLLATLMGFYRPLEARLSPYIDCPLRAKAGLIAQDLSTLGIDANVVADMPNPPVIRDLSSALGASYVMEGATLGGAILGRAVRDALGPTAPLQFYDCYGDARGRMWQDFVAQLPHLLVNDEEQTRAVATARSCFEALSRWLDTAPTLAPS